MNLNKILDITLENIESIELNGTLWSNDGIFIAQIEQNASEVIKCEVGLKNMEVDIDTK